MYFLTRTVELLISPLGIMVMLLGFGVILRFHRRWRSLGRKFLFCGAVLFLIFLFSPLAKALILNLEKDYAPLLQLPQDPKVNKILILAGYAEEHPGYPITSLLSEPTIGNLTEGLRLYHLMPDAVIVVSGGVMREGEQSFAASMADFLVQMGVPENRILIEGRSQNTHENFLESWGYLQKEPFILVAQACDMRRAMAVARKLKMQPVPAPASFWVRQHFSGLSTKRQILKLFGAFLHPTTENLNRIQWAYHEYVGYYWYRFCDRI
jgi:uncharacterized SAM-binding protein YcdF (DUF218 family)